MSKTMAFEEPVIKLREKIEELKQIAETADVDMNGEISKLEDRLFQLEQNLYSNMEPWDRVQVARHPERPTTSNIFNCCSKTLSNCMVIASMEMMQPL